MVSLDDVDAADICIDECGTRCCSGGAFVRDADVDALRDAGVGDAVAEHRPLTRTDEAGDCALLDADGRCTVYEDRPLDCRLFPLGFRLDDDDCQFVVVLATCPLAETVPDEIAGQLVRRAKSLLAEFDAESLRAYDDIPFTTDVLAIGTIPYSDIPIDL